MNKVNFVIITNVFRRDDRITVPTDLAELQQMLESIEPGSTHGFMSFLTDVYKKYEIARRYFFKERIANRVTFII